MKFTRTWPQHHSEMNTLKRQTTVINTFFLKKERNLPDSSQQHCSADAGWIDFLAVYWKKEKKKYFPVSCSQLAAVRLSCVRAEAAVLMLCSALQVSLPSDPLRELAEGKKEGAERKWSHIRKPPNCPLFFFFSPSSRDGDGARLSSGTGRDDIKDKRYRLRSEARIRTGDEVTYMFGVFLFFCFFFFCFPCRETTNALSVIWVKQGELSQQCHREAAAAAADDDDDAGTDIAARSPIQEEEGDDSSSSSIVFFLKVHYIVWGEDILIRGERSSSTDFCMPR